MIATSPLRRAAEQPPCDSEAEALCLNGMFAVPARMEHYDLGLHLWFPEHQAIWQSMLRAAGDDPDGFWWRTLQSLARERTMANVWQLLGVLEWAPFMIVDNSDDGCLLFMLAFKKLERCTQARCELSALQARTTRLWRVPGVPYTDEEKRRMFGAARDIGFEIP